MKKLILSLVLLSSSTLAQGYISLEANCNINSATARCEVYNYLNQPVYCEATAQGITRYGFYAEVSGEAWILPGHSLYLNVNANNPFIDPLIEASAFTDCHF